MYLAPLNFDRFFERIFQDTTIAKQFLEDFLDVAIEEITPLPRKNKLTDDAAFVEFDYRCKIEGRYVILDMQQWYKADVVRRFYLYSCNNTSLQLESLSAIIIPTTKGTVYKTKDYSQILPAITIVWMADDGLGFIEDMVVYATTPEILSSFILDNSLWHTDNIEKLFNESQRILKIVDNNHKNLKFLSENRLIFAFQKNIVKNKKMEKYFLWFDFAQLTKNPDNKASDFESYRDKPIFSLVMEKLKTSEFNTDDFQYITDYPEYLIGLENYNKKLRREFEAEMVPIYEKRMAHLEKQVEKRIEKQVALKTQQFEHTILVTIKKCLMRGDSEKDIMDFLEMDNETLQHYLNLLSDKTKN